MHLKNSRLPHNQRRMHHVLPPLYNNLNLQQAHLNESPLYREPLNQRRHQHTNNLPPPALEISSPGKHNVIKRLPLVSPNSPRTLMHSLATINNITGVKVKVGMGIILMVAGRKDNMTWAHGIIIISMGNSSSSPNAHPPLMNPINVPHREHRVLPHPTLKRHQRPKINMERIRL